GIFSQQSKSSKPSANFRQFVTLPAWRPISWINSKGVVYHECHDRRAFPCDVGLKRAIESSSPEMQRAQISALREGALASAGLLVGIVPWGIVAGVAMVSAGLTQPQAVAMSVLVFAGTAQLAVLPLLIAKAPLWVMIATALGVNLRYVIYRAVLAPHFEHPRPDRFADTAPVRSCGGVGRLGSGRRCIDHSEIAAESRPARGNRGRSGGGPRGRSDRPAQGGGEGLAWLQNPGSFGR